jgi:hypothetical protein
MSPPSEGDRRADIMVEPLGQLLNPFSNLSNHAEWI